jgi:hypothetical protein
LKCNHTLKAPIVIEKLHEIGTNSLFGWNKKDIYLELLVENAVGNTILKCLKYGLAFKSINEIFRFIVTELELF